MTAQAVSYGAYDFAETMGNSRLAIEETFVNQSTAKGWANATEERSLYDLCMAFKSKGRMPLITIEPRSGGDVLQNVATGKCDAELAEIAAELRGIRRSGHRPLGARSGKSQIPLGWQKSSKIHQRLPVRCGLFTEPVGRAETLLLLEPNW